MRRKHSCVDIVLDVYAEMGQKTDRFFAALQNVTASIPFIFGAYYPNSSHVQWSAIEM